jgi:hypothetical protein
MAESHLMLKAFALFANNHHHQRNRDALCANVSYLPEDEKKKKFTFLKKKLILFFLP